MNKNNNEENFTHQIDTKYDDRVRKQLYGYIDFNKKRTA